MKEKDKKIDNTASNNLQDMEIDCYVYRCVMEEFDKPLKLTQTVKMIGAPSDYNDEMEKWEKMMAENEGK